jgi:hypothetical protein
MRNTIILCLLLASCAKEDYIEEVYISTQTQINNTVTITPTTLPENEYDGSLITINHSLSSEIWQGIDIAFNGAVNYIDDIGTETILLSPSYARWPLADTKNLPTFKLKKVGGWAITDYYDNINMGMGGKSVTPIENNGFLYADTGPEVSDLHWTEWPMNHLWLNRTVNGITQWTQISTYKSFYHSGAVGDFNHDGLFDVAAIHLSPSANPDESRLHIYLQNSDGSFEQQWIVDDVIDNGAQVLAEDLDGDNIKEIIVTSEVYEGYSYLVDSSVKIFSDADQDGYYTKFEFVPRVHEWLKESIHVVHADLVDYDKDGDKDLLALFTDVSNENYRSFGILNNNGDGTFSNSNFKIEWNDSNSHIVGFNDTDIDNDGDLDIVFNAMNVNGISDEVFDEVRNQINLKHLVWENINNSYIKYNIDVTINIPNVKDIKWIKGVTVGDTFKFLAVQQINQLQGTFNLLELYIR